MPKETNRSAPSGATLRPLRKDLPKNQRGVALAWKHGYSMRSGNMRTDGLTVWSWRMEIGVTDKDGRKIARDLRGCVSGSTTRHIGELMHVADDTLTECKCIEATP